MAIDTAGFGRVSRTKGVVFRYVTLAASLIGIVALAILLGFVTIDAFGLDTAGPGWYLAYAVGLLPAGTFAYYGYRNRDVGRVGVRFLGVLLGGLGLVASVLVVFVVVNPQQWSVYYTTTIVPVAAVLLYGRRTDDTRAPLVAVAVGIIGIALGAVVWRFLLVYPVDWLIFVWTLAVPIGAGVGFLVYRRADRRDDPAASARRSGLAAGAIVVAGAWVTGAVLDFPLGLGRGIAEIGVIAFLGIVVPAGTFVGRILADRRGAWPGLFAPVVIVGGALLGWTLVEVLGARRPDVWLDPQYLTSAPSRFPTEAGLYPAIVGSVFIIVLVGLISFVLGVGAAIYLEEYAPASGPLGALTRLIQVNISNLAGVPSVVYGLLGLGLFVNLLGMGFGTVIVAALTLSLLILPIVIISAREAIRSVPDALRQASYGMGATRWQTVKNVVLPRALPGILTGTILALGRAIGETAPLIMIGLPTTLFSAPAGLSSRTSAMPMQIFAWSDFPQEEFRYGVVAAGVVTLLVALLAMNSAAIYLRNRYEREA